MSSAPPKSGFATRPGAAERWIRADGATAAPQTQAYSARLTIDVTPAMRKRLKLAAVTRGTTVADLIRAMIEEHVPESREAAT